MPPQQTQWYKKNVPDILTELKSRESGLTKEEALMRLQEYGPNKLPEGKVDSLFTIFLRQFQSPLIYILLAATFVVLLMKEIADALIIFSVLLFNAIVGTIQEGKAQNSLIALKRFSETNATVLRDGREIVIKDSEVVQGDLIVLNEGEKIPADARIILSNTLKIDEASLTGESNPVAKVSALDQVENDLLITEQKNMVFKGTHVINGSGTAIVVATGLATEIGKIAQTISAIDTEVPLKTNIRKLSSFIIYAAIIINIILIFLGLATGKSIREMLATAVALSVFIIPEGLPIVITLVLATGVMRMAKRNVLVKRLQAVEALGQTKIMAVDKTGTLTRNEMVIQRVYVGGKVFSISGNGYEPLGEVTYEGRVVDSVNHPELLLSGKAAAFCSHARLSFSEETKSWSIAGDPTEAATLVFSEKMGFRHEIVEMEMPKLFEMPFDYQKKFHSTIRKVDGKNFLTVIGAPEEILNHCVGVWASDGTPDLSEEKKKELEKVVHNFAQEGFRVVAFAINENAEETINSDKIPHLTFVGFFGMHDALRQEAKDSVEKVRTAGMHVVMITGDHKLTAQAIAKEAGIWREGDTVLTGKEIDEMSTKELADKIGDTSVFARVTPTHKLRIIQAYRERGEIVAMTGDGVNDAPSLVAADIGVAMGKTGTEVAKEAADIVLLNDDFSSIVDATKEGRNIYKTVKKVITFLFATSVGGVINVMSALLLGWPIPLLPSQIIWLNFVTGGFLTAALAMEPKEHGLLKYSLDKHSNLLIDRLMISRIALMSIVMAAGTLFVFSSYFESDIAKGWTMALTTIAIFQWFSAWNIRSEGKSIFQVNPFSNMFLVGAMIIVVLLQLLAVYNPTMNSILHTVPLELSDWMLIISVASSIIVVEEIRKFFYRRKNL